MSMLLKLIKTCTVFIETDIQLVPVMKVVVGLRTYDLSKIQ
jgi:hypothetical protein